MYLLKLTCVSAEPPVVTRSIFIMFPVGILVSAGVFSAPDRALLR